MGSKEFDLREFIKVAYDLAQPRKIEPEKLHECSVVGLEVEWDFTASVIKCYERESGKLFVENWGYVSRVNYCPFCGYKSKKQMELKKGVDGCVVG